MTKILVVEDEASFSDALAYLLGREGFDVSVADTGPGAIEEFDRHGADLILLDLMLPGLPGTEVCRQIRGGTSVTLRERLASANPWYAKRRSPFTICSE